MDSGQNTHQGRFTGTILADQSVYLTSATFEGYFHQGTHAGERFLHLCDRQYRYRALDESVQPAHRS